MEEDYEDYEDYDVDAWNQHNDVPELEVLGPDCVSAWTDLGNVNNLCLRCGVTFDRVRRPEESEWRPEERSNSPRRGAERPVERWEIPLWIAPDAPTLAEVRTQAHRGCHFCTLIISYLLMKRKSFRLGAEPSGIGSDRRGQDKLYGNDSVEMKLEKHRSGDMWLLGGIRVWCAPGDRLADILESNVGFWALQSRLVYPKTFSGWSQPFRQYCHELARFRFDVRREKLLPMEVSLAISTRSNSTSENGNVEQEGTTDIQIEEPSRQLQPTYTVVFRPPPRNPEIETLQSDDASYASRISTATSAEKIAAYWLDNCVQNHENCRTNDEDPILPTRVVDLAGKTDDGHPYLLETQGMRGRYVTLSYRWGDSFQLTTTASTIQQRHHSVPLEEMPHTFRDVVKFVRALGIRYIWIDALCILQDSEEDCERELAGMADIYSQSTLTIASVGALNANDRCTPCRNKLAMYDCQVSDQMVVSRKGQGMCDLLSKGTIHERAWCFQETEIAPHVLSIGANELYWQCKSGLCQESEPTELTFANDRRYKELGNDTDSHASFDTEYTWPIQSRLLDHSAFEDSLVVYRSWHRLVSTYCKRDLTFSHDKLPAISALAKELLRLFVHPASKPEPEDYYCGLWRKYLLPGLLWADKGRLKSMPVGFRAPSWSWAAADFYELDFPVDELLERRIDLTFCAEVLEIAIQPISKLLPFGGVKSGKLTLCAPTSPLPAACYGRHDDDWTSWKDGGKSLFQEQLERDAKGEQGLVSPYKSPPKAFSEAGLFNDEMLAPPILSLEDNVSGWDERDSQSNSNRRTRERNGSFSQKSDNSDQSSEEREREQWLRTWSQVNWDIADLPTNDCHLVRISKYHALIVMPVRKPGTFANDRAITAGVFTRVGMIDVASVAFGTDFLVGSEAQDAFIRLDWRYDVVTII